MQHVVVNCETGESQVVDMTPEEEANYLAQQEAAMQAQHAQEQATQDAAMKRAEALDTILNAPEICQNPALRDALAHLLGAE